METSKLREMWSSGEYDEMASNYYSMAGHLVERTKVLAGDEVLDVGCGTGTVAITAARQDADVTGVDITPALLDQARGNAEVAGVEEIDWREGDATALPFEDERFDETLSSVGHMYGDPPEQTTTELLRVTRPGGYIGFTAWTPTSLFPFMAGVLTTYLPSDQLPDFSEPPFSWGDSDVVQNRLGAHVERIAFETETVLYPALSPAQFWQEVSSQSGVFTEYLDAVDDDDWHSLRTEMVETIRPYFDERRNAVELEYLLTTATI